MDYHLTGAISTFFFLLTLAGLREQIRLVWKRKKDRADGKLRNEGSTAILSLNQFTTSFLAFFSYFVYGFCLERFNHYLVWPRLVAIVLVSVILFEIANDRRERIPIAIFCICLGAPFGALGFLLAGPKIAAGGRIASQTLVVVAAVLLVQGYLSQVFLIRRSGKTGAVSRRMHQLFLARDVSTIAFGLAMGLKTGWPLLVMNGASAFTKVVVLYHFRWACLSLEARGRREKADGLERT